MSDALTIAMGGQIMSTEDKIRARQAAQLAGSFDDMRLDNQRREARGSSERGSSERGRGGRGRGGRGLIGSDRGQQRNGRQQRPFYEEFLTKSEVEDGLADGTLMKGVLRINKRNQHDSYVTVEGHPKGMSEYN
jgi:hypothetical protein